ncbi:12086_t:CDS:2 [Gigaspora rosea]|nr:12086_t:CDS:2 [Gigaspora rosea]
MLCYYYNLIFKFKQKNISSANPDATKVRTEFLRDNNLKSKKRKRTSKLSSNDKGKKKIQYPLYEGDSDAYDSEQSHASILTEGSQISGRLNEKEFTQETDTTNSKKILDTVNKIETNEALLLKNNFRNFRNSQLIVYGDRLFSKNRSIEDLLTTKFSHIFNDNDVINCSSSLPSYSTNNIESLENYFKVWSLQYDQLNSTKAQLKEKMLKLLYELGRAYLSLLVTLANEYEQKMGKLPTQKTLRGFVVEKIKSILNIDDRQERKYWRGTWRLIELLNITHCPASILIESGITVRYLMISENEKYDQFLKNLLDDTVTRHETPIFDESLIQRIRNKVLLF